MAEILAKKYADAVKNNKIKEEILKKLPMLITCDDWKSVEIIGRVYHKTELAIFNGVLGKYKGGLYFIPEKIVLTLGKFDSRFLKVKNYIEVEK